MTYPMTEQEYDEQMANRCLAGFVTGEFGTDCDIEDPNHPMPHEGQDPLDDRPGKRVQWEGGGFCAGDPLPYRNVKYIG